jgi:hypothetical protein
MLQVLKDRGVNPKRPNDPDGAPVQPVSRHCDRAGPRIGSEMLKRAGEAGSHHVFRRQQRQKTEKADANPRQEPKRCSEEASAHPRRLSGLGGFGKSGPRVLAPPALTLVPAEVAGAVLEAGARRISSLRANGKRASWEFPRQAPCSVPDRAATDPCLSLASLRFGKGRLLKSFSMVPVQRRSTRHACATYTMIREIGFALDSPLEQSGFELAVPPSRTRLGLETTLTSSAQISPTVLPVYLDLLCSASHSIEPMAQLVLMGCGLRRSWASCASRR